MPGMTNREVLRWLKVESAVAAVAVVGFVVWGATIPNALFGGLGVMAMGEALRSQVEIWRRTD